MGQPLSNIKREFDWQGFLAKGAVFQHTLGEPQVIRFHPVREQLAKLRAALDAGTIRRLTGSDGKKRLAWLIAGRHAAEIMLVVRRLVDPEWQAEIDDILARCCADGRFACMECGKDTLNARDYYMMRGVLWESIVPGSAGMLCRRCCERRLGRDLADGDFEVDPRKYAGLLFRGPAPGTRGRITPRPSKGRAQIQPSSLRSSLVERGGK
jgi:hypothetical protein